MVWPSARIMSYTYSAILGDKAKVTVLLFLLMSLSVISCHTAYHGVSFRPLSTDHIGFS